MEDLVFNARNGKPHYDMNVRADQRKIVARLQEQGVEIEDCTFHTLRY